MCFPEMNSDEGESVFVLSLCCLSVSVIVVYSLYRLIGLVVKTSALRVEALGFDSCLHSGEFAG